MNNPWKKYKVAITIIAIFLIVASGTAIISQQSVLGEPNIKITRFGVMEKRTMTQEVFNTDKPGTCKLDDQRLTACSATQNYDSKPGEGTFHYWVDGWKELQSCAGFLSYYGCYNTFSSGNCDVINSGTCPGSASDSNAVECAVDTDCNSAPNQYCYGGKCVTSTQNECSGGVYKCNSGSLYRCGIDKQYHWYDECTYLAAKGNDCVTDGATNADPKVLCKNDPNALQYEKQLADAGDKGWTAGDILCHKDADCKGEAHCQDGLCTADAFLPDGRRVEMKEGRTLGELPTTGDPCTQNYQYKCPSTGQVITPAKCVDNKYQLTSEKCTEGSTGFWTGLWENNSSWFIAGFIGIALVIIVIVT